MDVLVALAISIGVLIAGWTYVALGPAALPVWAGIVAWGCFFAAGGKTTGLTKTIASNLSGVLWAFLALAGGKELRAAAYRSCRCASAWPRCSWSCRPRSPLSPLFPGAFLGAATAVSVVVRRQWDLDHDYHRAGRRSRSGIRLRGIGRGDQQAEARSLAEAGHRPRSGARWAPDLFSWEINYGMAKQRGHLGAGRAGKGPTYQDSVVTFFFRFRRRAAAVLMARASLGLT